MNKNYNWKTDGKEAGPFMNLVKYFRNGRTPVRDAEWEEFKNNQRGIL